MGATANTQIRFYKNLYRDCRANCLGRGTCAVNQGIVDLTYGLNDLGKKNNVLGKCLCKYNFQGRECEQCGPSHYGFNCQFQCPKNSHTYLNAGEYVYPLFTPNINHCICDENTKILVGDKCVCKIGRYLSKYNICELCKPEMDCSKNGNNLENLKLKRGYWRIGKDSLDIRRCPEPSYCIASNTSGYCLEGHTGIMCLSCEDGKSMKSNKCIVCTDDQKSNDKTFAI